MKNNVRNAPAGSHLFFLEMIIVLLFFGIASAVILNAFAAADSLSRKSGRLERLSFCAQSAAEIFSGTGSVSETASELFGIEAEDATTITLPLNEECGYSPANASMFMTMAVTDTEYDGRLLKMQISFRDKSGEELYKVSAASYSRYSRNGGEDGLPLSRIDFGNAIYDSYTGEDGDIVEF